MQLTGNPLAKILTEKKERLRNLYYIRDKKARKILFSPNEAQADFEKNASKRNILLKSRQLGITTYECIDMVDDILFNRDFNALLISHDRLSSLDIFDSKIDFLWNNLDPYLKKLYNADTETKNTLKLDFGDGSFSTMSVRSSGRSGTYQRVHVCLSGESKIVLKAGIIKKIRDISSGEDVLTSRGSYQRVKAVIKNKLSDLGEKLYSVKVFGQVEPLKLTGSHKVMCRPKRGSGRGMVEWKKAQDVSHGDYLAYPIREMSMKRRSGFITIGKAKVRPDFDFGRLCGLYISEGSSKRSEIIFSVHQDEVADVISLLEKFKNILFSNYGVCPNKNSKAVNVSVCSSRDFALWLRRYFGHRAENKTIPDEVWGWGADMMHGIVKGFIDGDGSYKNVRSIEACSISERLIYQLKLALISLRFGYPTIYYDPASTRWGRNNRERWTLKLGGSGNYKFRKKYKLPLPLNQSWRSQWEVSHNRIPWGRKKWRRGTNVYWAQVTDVSIIEPEEFVYDLSLESFPHDYVSVQGVVHNSEMGKMSLKYPQKVEEIMTGTLPAVPFSGRVDIESTAEGTEGEFYQLFMEAWGREPEFPTQFKAHFYSWVWDKDELNDIERTLPDEKLPKEFVDYRKEHNLSEREITYYYLKWLSLNKNWGRLQQEFPVSPAEAFQGAIEGSYYIDYIRRAEEEGRVKDVPYDINLPVHTSWDLGLDDSNVIIFFQLFKSEIRIIDVFAHSGEPIAFYAKILKNKGYRYGYHYVPWDARIRNITNNKSVLDMMQEYGMNAVLTPPLSVIDGINAVRDAFSRIYFDKRNTEALRKALRVYRKEWDDKRGTWKDKPWHGPESDWADSLRYCIISITSFEPQKQRDWYELGPGTTYINKESEAGTESEFEEDENKVEPMFKLYS